MDTPLENNSYFDPNATTFVPRSSAQNLNCNSDSTLISNNKNTFSYSQVASTSLDSTAKKIVSKNKKFDSRPLCTFFLKGSCRNGEACRFSHSTVCPICKVHVFSSEDSEVDKKIHQDTCKLDNLADENIECCICMERVKGTKSGRFGLLSNQTLTRTYAISLGCEHPFCLDCIRHWRSNSGMDSEVLRTCPICRCTSYFIIPSVTWVTNKEEKELLSENYKNKLRSIPCRHFNFGEGQCPFGSSCFYDHTFADGSRPEYELRKIKTADEDTLILNQVKLSDFFEVYRPRD